MNKTQRIRVNLENNEKNIFVNLHQDVDTFEIMSLKLKSKDIYRDFNSNFGVVIGRVIANGGVGIPNARISVFIPLDEEDENNPNIVSVYPYKTPLQKNNDGKRYNLLPRVSILKDGVRTPNQPFGSFPTKAEILTNDTLLKVYKKYYKYNAITNESGDYMIFGVPIGTQTLHLSVDVTDIGEYSINPAGMVKNLGYSSNLFIENNTKIKPSNDLDDLPHIETQEITVDVVPFWGDSENFEIGITRQDFRIRTYLVGQFVIFGTAFTDQQNVMWGGGQMLKNSSTVSSFFRLNEGGNDWVVPEDDGNSINEEIELIKLMRHRLSNGLLSINKRSLNVEEQIFYYDSGFDEKLINNGKQIELKGNVLPITSNPTLPNSTPNLDGVDRPIIRGDIIDEGEFDDTDDGVVETDTDILEGLDDNPRKNIMLLDRSQYSRYTENGDFIYIVNTNRRKILTSESGDKFEVSYDNPNGVYTEFSGFITIDIDPTNKVNIKETVYASRYNYKRDVYGLRSRIKIPQKSPSIGRTLRLNENNPHNDYWRGLVHTFTSGKMYSVAKFHPLLYHKNGNRRNEENKYYGLVKDINILDINKHSDNTNLTNKENIVNNSCVLTNLPNKFYIDNANNYVNLGLDEKNQKYEIPANITIKDNANNNINFMFVCNWLNFALYLPQIGYATNVRFETIKTNPYLTAEYNSINYTQPNDQELVGGVVDTSRYLRDDLHWTTFIEVPKEDIPLFHGMPNNGIYYNNPTTPNENYVSGIDANNYMFGNNVLRVNQGSTFIIDKTTDKKIYFYRGAHGSNCFNFLERLKIF